MLTWRSRIDAWNGGHAEGEAHEPVRSTVQGVGFRLREVGNRRFPFPAYSAMRSIAGRLAVVGVPRGRRYLCRPRRSSQVPGQGRRRDRALCAILASRFAAGQTKAPGPRHLPGSGRVGRDRRNDSRRTQCAARVGGRVGRTPDAEDGRDDAPRGGADTAGMWRPAQGNRARGFPCY